MAADDALPALRECVEHVRTAAEEGRALRIVGGDTKRHLAAPAGVDDALEPLEMGAVRGIVSHEPSELVVTVRAGTPLAELEAALAAHGQWLPFEPPHLGPLPGVPGPGTGTVGGMVAAALAGPARAAVGGVRDYVLGALLLDGRGELLRFGGEVMKNVAGYDVSRLLAGSWGALGALCEVSLKVLPMPPAMQTLRFEMDQPSALDRLNAWAGQPLPLNASVWWRGTLCVRLAGAPSAVAAAAARLGGEPIDGALAQSFWRGLRDQTDEYFVEAAMALGRGQALWRQSVPSQAPVLAGGDDPLIEWFGAQRWVLARPDDARVSGAALAAGGSARIHRFDPTHPPAAEVPRRDPLALIQRRLKASFDPRGVFVCGAPVAREMAPDR